MDEYISYYPVRTIVGREKEAANHISQLKLMVRIPMTKAKVKARRLNRYVDTDVPFLPGYIFVRKNHDISWMNNLRWSQSVIGFIEINGQIAEVSHVVYEDLAFRASRQSVELIKNRKINKGDHIEVSSGLFKYSSGSFIRMINDIDACVHILMNNNNIKIVLPADDIIKT